jgi:hypothetical protein
MGAKGTRERRPPRPDRQFVGGSTHEFLTNLVNELTRFGLIKKEAVGK